MKPPFKMLSNISSKITWDQANFSSFHTFSFRFAFPATILFTMRNENRQFFPQLLIFHFFDYLIRHLRIVTVTSFSVEAVYFLEPEVTCVQLKVVRLMKWGCYASLDCPSPHEPNQNLPRQPTFPLNPAWQKSKRRWGWVIRWDNIGSRDKD